MLIWVLGEGDVIMTPFIELLSKWLPPQFTILGCALGAMRISILPISGYVAYVCFGSAIAVVACILSYIVIVNLLIKLLVTLISR